MRQLWCQEPARRVASHGGKPQARSQEPRNVKLDTTHATPVPANGGPNQASPARNGAQRRRTRLVPDVSTLGPP